MVMAGGSFRFAYYLGMYSAAVEAGKAPDLILASCGGAIAAAVIQSLPDDAARKDWISSPEMYAFLCALQSTPKAALGRSFIHALGRRWRKRPAARIPDLFDDYFFDIPARLPLPPANPNPTVDVAIVGGKILFGRDEVGQVRGNRKLYAETIFCNQRGADLLAGMDAPMGDARWGDSAIAAHLETDTGMALADAARISISDMYYFPCHAVGSHHYTGGVIDLFPIELAHRMARSVVIEMKAPFSQPLAIPALRAVLGIDGNDRLRHVHGQHADTWVDTSDVEVVLASIGMQKRLCWRENRIRLVMPATQAQFARDVETQWEYGYQRGKEAFQAERLNHKEHMRLATRHNRGHP